MNININPKIKMAIHYINNNNLIYFILYKIFLEIIYINNIVGVFGYVGYRYSFDFVKYIISFGVFLCCIRCLPKCEKKLSSIFNLILFLMSIIPMLIVFQFSELPYWMVIIVSVAFCIQSLILGMNIKFPKIKRLRYSNKLTQKIFLILSLLIFIGFVIRYGLPDLSKIGFANISEVRAGFEYKGLVDTLIITLFCKILNPLLIAVSITKKEFKKSFIFIGMQVYIYAVTGFKTFLFIVPVVLFIVLIKNRNYFSNILKGFTFGSIGLYILYFITKNIYILALFHNRVLFFPGQIKLAYLDFFSKNEYLNFSQSTIGQLFNIESKYTQAIPNIIGEKYFNSPEMHANTGYLADGYANLGIIGTVIVAVVLAMMLNYLDSVIDSYSIKYALAILVLFAISLNDGALMTCLFSGGMGFAILLFILVDFDMEKPKIEGGK